MAFYPSSQIKQNLHTNGGEYILSTTKEEYKGYYYEVSTGKKYTGKSPNNPPNIPLEPIVVSPSSLPTNNPTPTITTDVFNIYSVLNKPLPERTIPQFQQTIPTQKDQQLGVFSRYFCKKNNELKYIEINQSTYNLLSSKSTQIAWDLYTPISTLWYIKGNLEKTYITNKNLIRLIEEKQKWYGFTQYFKEDFTKYFVY